MNIDVKRDAMFGSSIWVTNLTKLCERSKIVCRHEKAIVNPKVKTTTIRSCLFISFLNRLPTWKRLETFFFILISYFFSNRCLL